MQATKIAITIDKEIIDKIDHLVMEGKYESRSSLIQSAIDEKLKKRKRLRRTAEAASSELKRDLDETDDFLDQYDEDLSDF